MRRISVICVLLIATTAFAARGAIADDVHNYEIEIYNAFGLVPGSEVRIAGVAAGTITDLSVNEHKRALLQVELAGEIAQLGEDTTCESSPQSLIAEYFLDCKPAGEPLADGGLIPADQVRMTVQPDIVANTMREPFRRRLTLLINEFGTALAGNPENLSEAIRLGAPALTELEEATGILANQAKMVRAFNVHSEKVSRELADYREEIVDFVDEAEDVASTALERGEEVSRGFDLFDDYLGDLQPTLAQLDATAREQTPLMAALRGAAPGLHRLSVSLPEFQRSSEGSIGSLGEAAITGRRALTKGKDELKLLAEAGRHAPVSAEMVADLLRDIDDPRRAVEINDLAEATTGRTGEQPGTPDTKGYTGFEGLLNYPYYQALAINQFDQFGHSLHVNLYEAYTGPCGSFSSGRDPETGEPGIPTDDGHTTTEFSEIARCATWLGPNQPGVSEEMNLPPYDPSVCPKGTAPDVAAETLCDPGGGEPAREQARAGDRPSKAGGKRPGKRRTAATAPKQAGGEQRAPVPSPKQAPDGLDDLFDGLSDLPVDPLGGLASGSGGRGGKRGAPMQSLDLLDFLFGS